MKQFWMALGLGFLVILGGCSWLYGAGSSSSGQGDLSSAGMVVPEFEFVNQHGEPFGSEDLEGTYWLANMIFTSCSTVCPTMTPNMARLQDAMLEEGVDMQFVSFTVDPENDNPELLAKYGENVGANFEYWNFLTGYPQEEIAEFAQEGFKTLVQETDDDIIHSTSFFLIDGEGNVVRKYDGLASDQTEIVADLLDVVE
ncbi:SCO family protein [Halalkalibacterium ligniniphilum]|uniref:SCO family protein n=1 Tax=Halalkalibacterium ligniniphilum TaxID=1134413 RepID=UPI00034A7838|nr:SCO family protein [Halalkalibacterium ligniniphilum]